ncbi:MAG: hypothetical protein IKT56_05700 [Clostridia bacterium]|nr:hypothetical protein [Clostridia bacterium]
MKRTIKGKVYDTKTAKICCSCDLSIDFIDEFRYMTETLYETPEGNFFLYCDCEPRWELLGEEMIKKLNKMCQLIIPMTEDEADEWIDEADSLYL